MSIEPGQSAALLSVGHAVPPHRLLQSDAAAAARRIFAHRYAAFERMAPVFETAGIRTRYTVKPLDWYFSNLDWPERNAAYLDGRAGPVRRGGQPRAGRCRPARPATSTPSSPSPRPASPRRASRRGSPAAWASASDVERVPVFGLGCAGGVSGLAIAARLARARPGSTVLLVAIELCTLAFRHRQAHQAPTSSRRRCSATAPRPASCAPARRASRASRGAGEHLLARHARHHGMEGRSDRVSASSSTAPSRPSPRRMSAPAVDGILGAHRRRACDGRPLRLPSRRRQGDHRARARRCVSTRARSITSAPCWRSTATCRRRRCCSCSTGWSKQGLPARTVLTALGPGFTAQLRVAGAGGVMVLARAILGAGHRCSGSASLSLSRRNTAAPARPGRARGRARPLSADRGLACRVARRPLVSRRWAQPASSLGLAGGVRRPPGAARAGCSPRSGPRWTTRIIVLPGAPLVRSGPYRFVAHPNYCIVAAEILVLPLCFGLVWYGIVFSVLNALVLWIRIRRGRSAALAAMTGRAMAGRRRHLGRLLGHVRSACSWPCSTSRSSSPRCPRSSEALSDRARPDELGADGLSHRRGDRDPADRPADARAQPALAVRRRALPVHRRLGRLCGQRRLRDADRRARGPGLCRRRPDPVGVLRRLPAVSLPPAGRGDDARRRHGRAGADGRPAGRRLDHPDLVLALAVPGQRPAGHAAARVAARFLPREAARLHARPHARLRWPRR